MRTINEVLHVRARSPLGPALSLWVSFCVLSACGAESLPPQPVPTPTPLQPTFTPAVGCPAQIPAPFTPRRAVLLHELRGHTDLVESVAWSPDGRFVASGSMDHDVIVWDAQSGARLRTLSGHGSWVGAVEWSCDGILATGGGEPPVILWNGETGEQRSVLRGDLGGVDDMAFDALGTKLATADFRGAVSVWRPQTGERLFSFATGHSELVEGVEWSPDGTMVATGSYDHSVVVWNASSGARIHTLLGHDDWVRGLAWSPVAPRLASGSYHDGRVIVWNPVTAERVYTLADLGTRVSVKWSPDGTILGTGLHDGTVVLWDATTFERRLTLRGPASVVEILSWAPDGRRLAAAAYDHSVWIWRLED